MSKLGRPRISLPDGEIVSRYRKGETLMELAERFDCSWRTIRTRIPDEDMRPRGNRPGKLLGPRDEARARQIVRMRKNEDTFASIGARFGFSRQRAQQIFITYKPS